jgi:hypothetical protein
LYGAAAWRGLFAIRRQFGNHQIQLPMIFVTPAALIGLLALAGPIVIHLLMRREAARVRFPTLRFLAPSQTFAIRRHRLSDWRLLVLRLAVLSLAVLALADPVWVRVAMRAARQRVTRAIVLDASVSMDRPDTSGPEPIRERARRESRTLTASSFAAHTFEVADLGTGIRAACEWLARAQPSRRELLVFSDFQRGAFDSSALSCMPPDAGVTLREVSAKPAIGVVHGPEVLRSGSVVAQQISATQDKTSVTYVPTGETRTPAGVEVLGSDEEKRLGTAAIAAVTEIGSIAGSADRHVAIVFPNAPERAALDRRAVSLDAPWMFAAVARLRRALAHSGIATPAASPAPTCVMDSRCVSVNSEGVAVAYAASDRERLLLFTAVDAASLHTPLLFQQLLEARTAFPYDELEPTSTDATQLRHLERTPSDPPASAFRHITSGHHRLLWILVLIGLVVETIVRRTPAGEAHRDEEHARVA